MALWIDPPTWPAHGRLWSHLISDESIAELHAFADRVGLPRRGFEGDHYDVPAQWYDAIVAAGAGEVEGKELLRRLLASGLRLAKRKGERGVARASGVVFPDGTSADIDLILSSRAPDEVRTFAALTLLRDAEGSFALVHSRRRDEWGAPGGWREPGEDVATTAVREIAEETGLRADPALLVPCAYERFRQTGGGTGLWRPGQDRLQVYRLDLPSVRPAFDSDDAGVSDRRWATYAEYEELCGSHYYWPIVAAIYG